MRATAIAVLALASLLRAAAPASAQSRLARPATMAPATVYASVAGAGVFVSGDLSGPWSLSGSPLPADAVNLATGDPGHWQTIYAVLRNGGVYASHDNGNSWLARGPHAHTAAVLIPNWSPNSVIAAGDRGVTRSDDGGSSWTSTAVTHSITALAQGAHAIYAAGDGAAWVSTDAGRTWSSMHRGLPAHLTFGALAASPADPAVVYAATGSGLWRESNGVWMPLHRGLPSSRPYIAVAADAMRAYAVASSDNAVYVSSDTGDTWSRRAITGLSGTVSSLTEDSWHTGDLLVGGTDGNVLVSDNGGDTWSMPGAAVAGTVGSSVLALAIVHRRVLPVDGVPNPHLVDVRWFPNNGGHTLRGPFLAYWQWYRRTYGSAARVLGYPLTEEFVDHAHGDARAQYFERMELLIVGGRVVPAPLGRDRLQAQVAAHAIRVGSIGTGFAVDSHIRAYWSSNGGSTVFGPAISGVLRQANDDGTGRLYLVQYFRNARLEYHPEVDAVQGSLLGEEALQALGWQ